MSNRLPAVAANWMVASSQPLATRAGMRMLERGGNAADAVLASAAMLCVTEPMEIGVGGDVFALVCRSGRLEGLDAAGPAPVASDPVSPVEQTGPRSVTVPGAVAGWSALADRYGRLGLDACLGDAIDAAETGVAVSVRTALLWKSLEPCPEIFGPAPVVGERYRLPELAKTLRQIADIGPDAIYKGSVARAISSVSWLSEEDLHAYEPKWVRPLTLRYRDIVLAELPPPTQGVAPLAALGLLEQSAPAPSLESMVECIEIALEDARPAVRDGADVSGLLEPEYLARASRDRSLSARHHLDGGTAYTCAIDSDGLAVSFISSLYGGFGSGMVPPGTGIVLQNRGACFRVEGAVAPGKRPYHTIIPAMLMKDHEVLGPFGFVGGSMPQGHVQFVSALLDEGLDPQAALDRARFRVDGSWVKKKSVHLERGLWDRANDVRALGFEPVCDPDARAFSFGGGQAIVRHGDVLLGASDSRMDGYAAGA